MREKTAKKSLSTAVWKSLFLLLAGLAVAISVLAIADGLTPKPTDGLIWKLGSDRVIVEEVIPGGPGDRAGIRPGDIILGIDRQLVKNPREAAAILMKQQPGLRIPYLIQRGGEILTVNLVPHPYRTGDNRLLYNAIVGFFFLGIGFYTFYSRADLPAARVFFLLNICFLLVLTCSFRGSPYYWIDLVVQNVARWGMAFLGPLFLHFFLIFPTRKEIIKKHAWLLPVLYFIPLLQHIFFTLSQFYAFPSAVLSGGSAPQEVLGVEIDLWALLGVYLVAGVIALVHSYARERDPFRRRQIKLVLWGTFIGLSSFLTLSVIGAGIFGRRELFSFGVLPLLAIPLSFAYSIVRYRLLEIRGFVKSGILYSLLTGLFIGVYMIIVNVLGGWVERVSPFGGSVFGVLFVLLIAIGFEPTRFRLQKVINRLFYRSDYDRQTTLARLSESLRQVTDMSELARATLLPLSETFSPRELTLSVISDKPGGINVTHYRLSEGKLQTEVQRLSEQEGEEIPPIALTRESSESPDAARLHIGGISRDENDRPPERLELPIFSHDKVVGLLSLEAKQNGEPYTLAELEALENFAGQAGLAIENLQLIQSVFEANQRLFEAEKLASLGQLASGVAHEIRNPLSSIKMNIQGMARNLQLDATNERRLRIIQREIEHLDHIVHDVLIYARPSRLHIEAVPVQEVVLQTVELLAPQLNQHGHRIVLDLDLEAPPAAADRDKLHQVVKNLIVNAAEAMQVNGELRISSRYYASQVDLIFTDNGPGIPGDTIRSIFNPFFTTKADGTGLGLANARKFIQEMGGDIYVRSEPGTGTEFKVQLPLYSEDRTE